MIIWRMRIACRIPKVARTHARTHAHTIRICNNYCFPTIPICARTRLNVTLHVHCFSCFLFTCCLHPLSPI